MKCTNCGTEFEGNFCTNCGAKINTEVNTPQQKKKPFYKKPFFIIVAALILIAVIGNVAGNIKERKAKKELADRMLAYTYSNTSADNSNLEADTTNKITEKETTATTTTTTTTTKTTTTTTTTTKKSESNGLRPDFKNAMDSYEKFMDEYVAFMKKYQNSGGTDLNLLTDYASYMSKYSDMCDDFEKWEDEDMNNAELAYYLAVQARVEKKLFEVMS